MLYIEQLEEEIKEEQQNSDKQPKTMNELYNLPGKQEGLMESPFCFQLLRKLLDDVRR